MKTMELNKYDLAVDGVRSKASPPLVLKMKGPRARYSSEHIFDMLQRNPKRGKVSKCIRNIFTLFQQFATAMDNGRKQSAACKSGKVWKIHF